MATLSQSQIDEIAERLLRDYDRRTPATQFGEGLRLGISDAWRVQDSLTQARESRGERVVGYKIGCTAPGNQKMMGLTHPVWARLWSTEQHENGVALRKSEFANVGIEAEFALTLKHSIPGKHANIDDVVEAIDSVFPVLELHHQILRSDPPHGHELIANNAIHAGVVRGPSTAGSKAAALTDLALVFDGTTVDSWDHVVWPGDILSGIPWLASRLEETGRSLKSGDLILTGALGPPIPLGEGGRVDVTSSGFGNVHARFTSD